MKQTYIPDIENADLESLLYFSRMSVIWGALSKSQQARVGERIRELHNAQATLHPAF